MRCYRTFGALVAATLAIPACEKHETPVQLACDPPLMIVVSPANMSVPVGGRARVLALVLGTCSREPPKVAWEVRDTRTATVEAAPDSAGLSVAFVTGQSAGSTILVATISLDITVKAAAAVTVQPAGG